jgi:C_GCAxxG_C_C family probable redox protein
VLAALQATLGVVDGMVFRAGSALAGGVASQGETCGALTGAIMAIGCVVGRERLEDLEQYQKAKEPAKNMYHRFRDQVGHSICAEIHKIKFGRAFHLYDPEDVKAFHEAGGHSRSGCPEVCGIAARTAADIILRLREDG